MSWQLVFTLLVVAAAATWIVRARLRRGDAAGDGLPAFRIVFVGGRTARIDGHLSRTTLSAFEDIAGIAEISGEVRLIGPAELSFSESIPPGVRQQFRNAYVTSVNVH